MPIRNIKRKWRSNPNGTYVETDQVATITKSARSLLEHFLVRLLLLPPELRLVKFPTANDIGGSISRRLTFMPLMQK
jgi:hypothetical protein